MAGYQHNPATLEQLRYRQQIAQAEAEQTEKELAQYQELERQLHRLKRRKENATRELAATKQRTQWARTNMRLPEPIHGGPQGLIAATAEIAAWNAQHRKEAA